MWPSDSRSRRKKCEQFAFACSYSRSHMRTDWFARWRFAKISSTDNRVMRFVFACFRISKSFFRTIEIALQVSAWIRMQHVKYASIVHIEVTISYDEFLLREAAAIIQVCGDAIRHGLCNLQWFDIAHIGNHAPHRRVDGFPSYRIGRWRIETCCQVKQKSMRRHRHGDGFEHGIPFIIHLHGPISFFPS